jgi:hypothetical protein
MNIFKVFFFILIIPSALLSYSNTCGSPSITSFTINRSNQNFNLPRSSVLGSTTTFLVRNLSSNILEQIEFQLLATDGSSSFYGEVTEISRNAIDLTAIDDLFQTFTSSTLGADSLSLRGGIRAAEEKMLGLPPTIGGSLDVNVLFMDIRDGYSNSGEFVAGFFDPQDQYMCLHVNGLLWQSGATESTCTSPYEWKSNGNGLNLIYIDSNPSKINEDGLESALFTLAHEYQHLLHWNSDMKEGYFGTDETGWIFHNPWINEGLSDLMPSVLGLGLRDFTPYLANPIIGLDEWSEIGSSLTLPYYAKSALFFQYLYELEGLDLIAKIFADESQGLGSIKSHYSESDFALLYVNWIQSLMLGQLKYTYLNIEVHSENIENQFSIGKTYTSIQIDEVLPEYSFSIFLVPAYLTINEVQPGDHLAISLYNEGIFSLGTDLAQDGINVFEKIILYSQDRLAENISFSLGYGYRASPVKQNLFVYPNPIRGNIVSYVYFGDRERTGLSVKLLDLNGSQILSTQSHIGIHDNYSGDLVLNLSSGVYILQTVLNSGVSESRVISIIK